MTTPNTGAPGDLLDHMRYRADVLADSTIENILGPWQKPAPFVAEAAEGPAPATAASLAAAAGQWHDQWQKLAAVTDVFQQWPDNQSVANWRPPAAGLTPEVSAALQAYLQAGLQLPEWADRAKLERAEALFMDYGALSVTMLFCASLPECYVIPDLAAVLHVTGQLERHTEYRIRSTGAMVFPVMMKGGLTASDGGGIAQILKVRLIHATIRNAILRASPEDALRARDANPAAADAGVVPPLPGMACAQSMHQALFAHGWNINEEGLPCNQEELAYTLLTFSYVFLRSMRKLGIPLSRDDEEAYIHTWNVAGHVLGIERALMVDTMDEAEVLFAAMQARGRAETHAGVDTGSDKPCADPRPGLGNALINAMSQVIPFRAAKSFPLFMTRYLCGWATSRDLGLNGPVSWLSLALFLMFMLTIRGIDWLVRLVFPEFSISRFLTRLVGYQLMTKLMMDQTKPLKLPQHVRNRVDLMMSQWGSDAHAPQWMNNLEDSMTVKGGWNTSP